MVSIGEVRKSSRAWASWWHERMRPHVRIWYVQYAVWCVSVVSGVCVWCVGVLTLPTCGPLVTKGCEISTLNRISALLSMGS